MLVHLSQPALSSAIKVLETTIGGPLLLRTTRSFVLTPEGESFYPVALRLLADWDGAFDSLHQRFALRAGKISIAAMPSFASNQLPIAIRHFKTHHPEIKITLNDVIAEEVVAMVRSGRVELGVSFDPSDGKAGSGKQFDGDDLLFSPLFEDRFVAVLPPGHSLLSLKELSATQLLQSEFISLQAPSRVRQLISREFVRLGLSFTPAFETHQLVTIGRMVANGLGVSVVPSLCQAQMHELGAHCRPLLEPTIRQQVGIITRRRYPLSAACQAMANTLQDTFFNAEFENSNNY
ncbi:Hca operon transcriptional activator HcaR [Zhongshania aliphaticivorans]|uniref:Hca operon transcriptional activator HcaR n=1 Tax=Zhongshania aliphaticivorans TaxID=1470434 RepID=A0A5S9NPT7_9GAMM|nr:Hca operon transcriptional activator HcaR [Zhongshania aliphaticivorans]CAA0109744.1 Hca operon transcriptional activator HcaR [Zhongshania aliphaticivorans]